MRLVEFAPVPAPPQNTRVTGSLQYDPITGVWHFVANNVDTAYGTATVITGTNIQISGGIRTGVADPTSYNWLATSAINSFNDSVDPDDVFSLVGGTSEVNFGFFLHGQPERKFVLQTLNEGTSGGIEKMWIKPDGGNIYDFIDLDGSLAQQHINGKLFVDPGADTTSYTTATPATVSSNQDDVMGFIGSASAANLDFFLRGAADRKAAFQANLNGINGGAMAIYSKIDGGGLSKVAQWFAASTTNQEQVFGYVKSGQMVMLQSDWTCGTGGTVSSCVSAQTIGTLTLTFPPIAQDWDIDCNGLVAQSTGVTANNFDVQTATNGATNTMASYDVASYQTGSLADSGSSTSSVDIGSAWTLGAPGTTFKAPWHVHVSLGEVAASGTVFNLQLKAPNVGDLVTIYRGAACYAH